MPIGPKNSPESNQALVPSAAVDVTLTSDFDLTTQFAAGYARELYVGTAGTVVATMIDDSASHTYKNLANGSTLAGKFVTVKSTGNGTTASDIVARF